MKKNTSNKVKLGIFITLGLAVFIIGIYFIGERQQFFRRTFCVSGVFRDVGGLQEGNNVRLSGINVGTVEHITVVSDSSVRVEMLIVESTRKFIKKDAVASIGTEGLMGNKVLIINPGRGGRKEIENNDTVGTVQPFNMDDILTSLKTTIDNASNITSDLSKVTNSIQSGKGTLGRLLMDHTIAQNIDSSLVNLNQALSGLKNLVDDAHNSFTRTKMDDIMSSLKTTIDNTASITNDLSKITNNIESGKGTLGMLLMDQSMRQNFDSTFVNLKKGSAGFKMLMDKAKSSWLLWGF
jgi:phospholipid/cholesterol/gamma-HCH transport system substrate-binding protein